MTKAEQVNSELRDSYLCNCEGDCECYGYPTECRMMEALNSAEESAVLRLQIGGREYVVYDDGSYLDCEGDCERGYPLMGLAEPQSPGRTRPRLRQEISVEVRLLKSSPRARATFVSKPKVLAGIPKNDALAAFWCRVSMDGFSSAIFWFFLVWG